MKQFFKVISGDDALEIISQFSPLGIEEVGNREACGRVAARPVFSDEDLPYFSRSTMDGYAVKSVDTYGASETLPAMLKVSGHVIMGQACDLSLKRGEAVSITTGGMLPDGADAVVMEEHCHLLDRETIEVAKPVTPWENVLRVGDDVAKGEEIFPRGHRFRPQDIGLLCALGIARIPVYLRPRVSIISTGDELVASDVKTIPPGKIRDVNGPTVLAGVENLGCQARYLGIVPDNSELLLESCRKALEQSDVLLLSGGSSIGMRDFTLEVIDHLPGSDILFHGVAVKPGKPTILGTSNGKAIWGLPGHPVSTMVIMLIFVQPFLEKLEGVKKKEGISGKAKARIETNLASALGRWDFIRVKVEQRGQGEIVAIPLYGKSAMVTTMTEADGLISIPTHSEGLSKGSKVDVILL